MRARLLLLLSLCLVAPTGARAGALTQDACPGVVDVTTFATLGADVLENMLVDGENMFVSDSSTSEIVRLTAAGARDGSIPKVSSPGGLAKGPDGLIYAGTGNSAANALSRTPAATVIAFDPATGAHTTYASGFTMANGMTFGPGGDLFISNDFDRGLIRIPRADPSSWEVFTETWGANGLVVDPAGRYLYAAITFDQRSPIERIDLTSRAREIAARLSAGVASTEPALYPDGLDPAAPLLGVKGLDDMTRDAAGTLYVVGNGTGELLKVDPDSGAACLMTGGLRNPSSVRIAPEGGPFADGDAATLDLYVTEFSGRIMRVRAPA